MLVSGMTILSSLNTLGNGGFWDDHIEESKHTW